MEKDTTLQKTATKIKDNELYCSKCISEVICSDKVNSVEVNHTMSIRLTSRKVQPLFLLLRTVLVSKWIIFSVLINFAYAKEQRFAIEPQDQSAIIGSRVILPCRVENKVGQLQWTKDDFGLGTHRHLNGYERYKMVGSDEEGDYSLDIRDVTLEDDALYQCQVSSGPKGEPPIRSRYARLIVLVPPEAPRILQGSVLQTVEDQEVNLECVSIGGRPASEITWVDNDGGMLSQGVTYSAEPMLDGRRYTARSILRIRPKRSYHNQTFTCQAQNTADRTYRTTEVILQVQFAPKVRAFIKSGASNGRILEGETLSMGCQAIANPNNLTYKWYINGDIVPGDIRNELIIQNISRKYNEAAIKCEVRNSVGKSADTKTLEISYGPSFKIKPQNVEGEIGTTVTLNCMVDGHPQPKLLWLRYENERVIRVGKSSSLNVTVSEHTTGQYWCRGSVAGYRDIETAVVVFATGPPKLLTNHTQYGLEGDSVRVECISLSIPKPDYVIWSFGGNELNSFHDQEYAFLEETLPDRTTKSTLIIRKSETKHFGTYNCTVINSYGTDSVQILLIRDASIPLLFIISGCSTIIIIILITMLVIMLCHHRNKNIKKPDISDIDKKVKDSDQTSSICDLKLELRHIEGTCDADTTIGSETDLHPTLHLKSNLGLPLAGPVPLPEGYDNELMKQYQRYSGDFNQAINSLQLKSQAQPGYVPYVDYTRDYAPPDSLTGSLSRSIDGTVFPNQNPLQRQASCGRLGMVGPDVIPNPGVVFSGAEARYAASYANPYLGGSLSYTSQVTTNSSVKAPPPYYTLRNHNISPPVTSVTSPSSSSSSRRVTCSMTSSSSSGSAQPQVRKHSPQSSGSLYVLPASSHGKSQANHITAKGSTKPKGGTHV